MTKLWKKIDQTQGLPRYLDSSDNCYYAYEYISGKGYGPDGNQKIFNLKKPMSKKGKTQEWRYKKEAVYEFVNDLKLLFNDCSITFGVIPASKKEGSPDYDPRLEVVAQQLTKTNPKMIIYERPITLKQDVPSASSSTGSRDPEIIYKNFLWKGLSSADVPVCFTL